MPQRAERQGINMREYENRDYTDMEERLLAGREDYQKIPVPEEMRARLEAGIARAEAERQKDHGTEKAGGSGMNRQETKRGNTRKQNKKRGIGFRIGMAAAAAAAVLIILPNTGAGVAHAMGELPVVGKLFQAVTFRDYQYEGDRFNANVEVPQIRVDDMAGETAVTDDKAKTDADTGSSAADGGNETEASGQFQETVDQINFDIETVTNQLIEEFQASADLGESYSTLEIHHETVTDNARYFTLKLSIYQGAGSGYQSYKFYTVDKKTGEQVKLGDLFREDSNYNEVLSENIREQMRDRMAEDENKVYWVDYEEVPGWNFERLKEDQNFYFEEGGNLVIVFDEYEVAPGYMGAQEFTVERDVFEELLK